MLLEWANLLPRFGYTKATTYAAGHLVTLSNASSTITHTYDDLGQPLTVKRSVLTTDTERGSELDPPTDARDVP